ncbi:MAG: hypothetical protein SFX72_05865 [Isosphaeraceae bacterium]|nr:hypothetical protein [Isosphaeraceae bacterium]
MPASLDSRLPSRARRRSSSPGLEALERRFAVVDTKGRKVKSTNTAGVSAS